MMVLMFLYVFVHTFLINKTLKIKQETHYFFIRIITITKYIEDNTSRFSLSKLIH